MRSTVECPIEKQWRAPGDPVHDARLLRDYDLALDVLTSTGAPVVWLDHPPLGSETANVKRLGYDPGRMRRLDEIQSEVTANHPAVRVVQTMAFLRAWPAGVFDKSLRPDGLHFKGPGARPFVDWLGPEIVDAYWSASGAGD